VNDVTRLQALVDKKKVVVTKATIQEALRLDDKEGLDLSRMGYEKPSTKLNFYKAFFSAQWKFLIHTALQCMSTKRTVWNEFNSSMASAVICLATAQIVNLTSHNTKYISLSLTQKVFANMRRVGKGFSRVDTPLFEGMLVPQQVPDDVADNVIDVVIHADAEPTSPLPTPATTPPPQQELISSPPQVASTPPPSPHHSPSAPPSSPPQQQPLQTLQTTAIFMDLLSTLLKQRVRKLKKEKKLKASRLTRLRKGRLEESQAQGYHLDLEHAQKVLKVVTTAATTITTAPSAAKRRKGVVIRDPEETTTPSVIVHFESKSKHKGKGILVEEPKPLKKQA
nr:hypothetical protein [Tanacetum cinerariifolium]